MKIVIDIPEEHYKRICENKEDSIIAHDTCRRIAHGTPIPKGHGRLIDADELIHKVKYGPVDSVMDEDWYGLYDSVISYIENSGTIIEADKEGE